MVLEIVLFNFSGLWKQEFELKLDTHLQISMRHHQPRQPPFKQMAVTLYPYPLERELNSPSSQYN